MPILKKAEIKLPELPHEFHEHMGEAVRHQFLEKFHKEQVSDHRRALVALIAASPTIVLEEGSSIGKDEGSPLGYLAAKRGDKTLFDLDIVEQAITEGKVTLKDFLACVRDLDPKAVARVFDGKDDRPTITSVKSGEPVYSITAYPTTVALFKENDEEVVAADAALRDVLFTAKPQKVGSAVTTKRGAPRKARAKKAA